MNSRQSQSLSFKIILLYIFLSPAHLWAQMDCGTTQSGAQSFSGPGCEDWSQYQALTASATAVKRVRITIHVFQKDDGSLNLPDNNASDTWLMGIASLLNSGGMRSLSPIHVPTSSPYYSDSRIEYELATRTFRALWIRCFNILT